MSIGDNEKYMTRLSRQHPGLFVILLDQSASMEQVVEDKNLGFTRPFVSPNQQQYTKAEVASAAINTIIYELIQSAGRDNNSNERKKCAYLTVLGYNNNVYPLISKTSSSEDPIDIATLGDRRIDTIQFKNFIHGPLGIQEKVERRPYWIKPQASGNTHMASAFQHAQAVVDKWLKAQPEMISSEYGYQSARSESFPPVIINITDAMDNGGVDPRPIADNIRRLKTNDGEALIFNCHFTEKKGRSVTFPSQVREVANLDSHGLAEQLFHISSTIPSTLREDAHRIMRKPIDGNARCYVYNADPDILISFLKWGTRGQVGTRPSAVGGD